MTYWEDSQESSNCGNHRWLPLVTEAQDQRGPAGLEMPFTMPVASDSGLARCGHCCSCIRLPATILRTRHNFQYSLIFASALLRDN